MGSYIKITLIYKNQIMKQIETCRCIDVYQYRGLICMLHKCAEAVG